MSLSDLPSIVQEEIELLENNIRTVIENPTGGGLSEQDLIKQLIILRDEVIGAKEEDLPAIYVQMDQLNASITTMRESRKTEEVDPDSPYFAHLRLEEKGKSRDVFLGKATNLQNGLRIVDWRNAPISKLFYRYSEGDEYEEEFASQLREGIVVARRILHVQRGQLQRVSNSSETWIRNEQQWEGIQQENIQLEGGEGSSLRAGSQVSSQLGAGAMLRSSKHLPDIAALIDPEQFDLISSEHDGIIVIRGSAGSGKTTVALHRIAFLCFDDPDRFLPMDIMFIVWGKAMRDYIAHVLPSLGVQQVAVETWSRWAKKMFRNHFPGWPKLTTQITPDAVQRIKLHYSTAQRLEAWIKSTPKKPTTLEQVYDDWSHVLTDFPAIRRDMGDELNDSMARRAESWIARQTDMVSIWLEGDKDDESYLDFEDIALLLRAFQLRIGPLRNKGRRIELAHLALDEVQDFSPIEILVLLDVCDHTRSVTLAGDTRQHISKAAGFSSWGDFLERVGISSKSLSTLQVSYRSTLPIIQFAMGLLENEETPPKAMKKGPPVELFKFSEHGACVAFLAEELRKLQQKEPMANVALLTPKYEISQMYYDGLVSCDLEAIRLVRNQEFAFASGVDIVEVDQVKGLEFDYVVLIEVNAFEYPDTPHHRRLLHVGATRAVHQLWLTCIGTLSPILDSTMQDKG
jgi:DNA helicase II / ATP-dependent DNA helicase PcrA